MARIKEGVFAIETEFGIFDLYKLIQDKKEMEVLSVLKNDLIKEGNYPAPKQGMIDINSICAFIMYIDALTELSRGIDEKTEKLH